LDVVCTHMSHLREATLQVWWATLIAEFRVIGYRR
jgi:hypothetical protein